MDGLMHSLMERSISGLRSVIHGPALSLSLSRKSVGESSPLR